MKKTFILLSILTFIALGPAVSAWNLESRNINALLFDRDGEVQFTLFDKGQSGEEFKCKDTQVWFKIAACNADDAACIASVNRMAGMLLAAKTAGIQVHLERKDCAVTQVALKP